ncbi:MAG TPA: disulfide bond formation protein B [Piscinibacter sp.]|uniref:disulfide bond formation protein B n=1 Tax=Piscinibacter sp. TaxID=1903157 RepID=UPI0011D6105B|nr:MAG: disulfide bond formation protein B [Burkholderiaceae bacterium]HNJ83412.1 disulfide bond formation protein B [Piscinibacter sp.]HNK17560.1 disulfide bond formation protein B [Piscinibacter sp.]
MTLVPRKTFVALALLCIAAVGAALFTQYAWDMQPCPWCILQRVIFLLIAVLLLLAAYAPGRVLFAGLGVLAAGAGIAAALYQHFVAAKSTSCNLTLADKIVSGIGLDKLLPAVFEVRASCADAAVDLLHLPYEFWSLGLYVFVAVAALWALRSRSA